MPFVTSVRSKPLLSRLRAPRRLSVPPQCWVKRGLDISAAYLLLIILSPILCGIALIIRQDGGPALFRQQRIGWRGKPFTCYKFRSMHKNAECMLEHYLLANPDAAKEWHLYQKIRNDRRITPFGHLIRRTSLDELPQLINVIKGDMSLVGPRPIMPEQKSHYGDSFPYYISMRPGITGPWQVAGRNRLPFSERIKLEAHYVRDWNLARDVVILLKTIPVIFSNGQTS